MYGTQLRLWSGCRKAVQSAGEGFPHRQIDAATFDGTDFRNVVPRFTPENRKSNQAFVEWLTRLAARKAATPAQIALAWLLTQTLDRSHSGHDQAPSTRGESCGGRRRTDTR
jgi:hypothetical protein